MPKVQALTMAEMTRCRDAAMGHVVAARGIDDAHKLVIDVFAALYEQRYGPAEGSTAYNPVTGKTATRYFDIEFNQLRWLVLDPPSGAKITAERRDLLPGYSWKITARPWQELVYK